MENCRSYGSDKNLTFKCDLDIGPTGIIGTSTSEGERLCQIILKYIHNCRSYGQDMFGQTDAHTYTKLSLLQLMSRSPHAGLTKIDSKKMCLINTNATVMAIFFKNVTLISIMTDDLDLGTKGIDMRNMNAA